MDDELGTLQNEALAEIAHAQNVIELDWSRRLTGGFFSSMRYIACLLKDAGRSKDLNDKPAAGWRAKKKGRILERLEVYPVSAQMVNLKSWHGSMRVGGTTPSELRRTGVVFLGRLVKRKGRS